MDLFKTNKELQFKKCELMANDEEVPRNKGEEILL